MARYFSESNIEGFRECFFLNAPSGYLRSPDQLTAVMRSLNFSPTKSEARKYFKSKVSTENKLSFADFLDVMHTHSEVEDVRQEVLAAFKAGEGGVRGGKAGGRSQGSGYISAAELRHILTSSGERFTQREVDSLFREANIQNRGQVRYEEFMKLMLSPPPDYY